MLPKFKIVHDTPLSRPSTDPPPTNADIAKQQPVDEIRKTLDTLNDVIQRFKASPSRGDSYQPYFKETYALEVKSVLDDVLTTGRTLLIPHEGISIQTLRTKWAQAFKYLLINLDPQHYYKTAEDRILVRSIKGKGLIIRPKDEPGCLKGYALVDWKPEFLKFIDDSQPDDKFERTGIAISADEIVWMKSQLEPVRHLFLYQIDLRGMLVVRTNAST